MKQPNTKKTSLRGVGDEAISCNKEQIATLTLAMTTAVNKEFGKCCRLEVNRCITFAIFCPYKTL
ncbi:MAG: hypothetical protein ACK5MG_04225 [Bacteroidales bacterium]